MLCVSIGRGRHKHVIAEHRHLAEQGAQLVELRLDYINGQVNIGRLLEGRPCPVIASVRRQRDGGKWIGTEEMRQMILRTAIADGVDYVDLEEDIAGLIPRFGKTKRIVSLHDFTKTPERLESVHARLAALDADIVKIATMANRPHDNVRMLQLVQKSGVPTVGICMGEIGTPSRILAAKFGAPFTFATFHQERELAPGQISFQQMREIYRYEQIHPDTEVYGVIADPVGHSLSPLIHNAALGHCGLNKVYVPFRIPREDLEEFIKDCPLLGIKGLSVTIPHKEAVLAHCTKVDVAVKGIGAANTLVFREDERIGFNTDYRAAMDSLEAACSQRGSRGIEGKTALVLGAGGVARAIGFGLARQQARLIISSRTFERAQAVAGRLEAKAVEWDLRHTVKADILINCTPAGMHPNVDETPFDRRYLRPSMIVFDTVYNPERTLLVKEAREQHCVAITGVEMFIRQAALQFRHFTDQTPPVNVMRDALRRAIGPARYE